MLRQLLRNGQALASCSKSFSIVEFNLLPATATWYASYHSSSSTAQSVMNSFSQFRSIQYSPVLSAPKSTAKTAAKKDPKKLSAKPTQKKTAAKASAKAPVKVNPAKVPSYQVFASKEWHKHKADGDKVGDVSKKLAAVWRGMTDIEKAKFPKSEVRKKQKLSAYNVFMKEQYPKLKTAGEPLGVTARRIGEAWKKLSDSQKQVYAPETKPKRPISSGYGMFMKEGMTTKRQAGEKVTEVMKILAAQWKAMSEQDKQKYKNMVKK